MSFAAPSLLVLLLVVPAAVVLLWWLDRHRDERAAKWAPPGLLANMVKRPNGWHRWLPTALLLVGLTLLLVGFARPQAKVHVKRQDATVVLVLDTSGSMAAKDSPPTRLGAARAAALRVVDKLPKDYRIAVVTFTDHAAVVQAPTQDRSLVRAVLARARTGDQGTALGEAVGRAVAVARTVHAKPGSPRPPAIAVVFSDGGQTAGTLTPQQAGRRAALAHVPVSTVSVGTPDGIVQQQLRGGFTERIQVPVQPASLQTIAQSSGGRYFPRAVDFNPSSTISQLGSRFGSFPTREPKRVEVAAAAAAGGLVFMLAGGLLSGVWFRRIV